MAQDPRALMQKADKTLASAGGGFSMFGGKAEKFESAADSYVAAANAFRMQKMTTEAGRAFEKAAEVQISKLNEPDDAANSNVEAYKAYRKSDPEDAARCLQKAISHWTSKGNFRRAATHEQNLGELYEEMSDMKRAVEAYSLAAEWFEGDNAEALANKLWLKVADIAALDGDYQRAITQFEKVAKQSANNNLMRFSIKDYFLKAGICHLASQDLVATSRALDMYREIDPSFQQQREHMLLVSLSEAVSEGDTEKFSEHLFQYDQMSKLDKWKTTLLLRVKEGIEEKGEDFS